MCINVRDGGGVLTIPNSISFLYKYKGGIKMRLTRLSNIPDEVPIFNNGKIQIVCPDGTFLNKMLLLEQFNDYSNYWVLIYEENEKPEEIDAAKLNFIRFIYANYHPGYKTIEIPVEKKFLLQFSVFSDGIQSREFIPSFKKVISQIYNVDEKLVFLKWEQLEKEFLHEHIPDAPYQMVIRDGQYEYNEETGRTTTNSISGNNDKFDMKYKVQNYLNDRDIKINFIMSVLSDSKITIDDKWKKFICLHM